MRCRVRGAIADVHKPLVSAHKCLGFGRIAVLDENGGHLVPVNSKAGRAIHGIINRSAAPEVKTWLPVYQERGVYNFYLKTKGGKRQVAANAAETVEKELKAPEARRVQLRKWWKKWRSLRGQNWWNFQILRPRQKWMSMNPEGTSSIETGAGIASQDAVWDRNTTRTSEQREQNLVPTVAFDYAFMSRSDKDDERLKPILVLKDERTQMVAATFVDSKGATPYAVKFAAAFLKNLGYRKVVLKSDGEHSIMALKEAAAREAAIESVPEESPPADHQANGLVENAIREVRRQIRVLRSALEEKVGRVLPDEDPMLAWLPRQAADLLNRYKKRRVDARSPPQWKALAEARHSFWRETLL